MPYPSTTLRAAVPPRTNIDRPAELKVLRHVYRARNSGPEDRADQATV